jgi:hypothetical protein
LVGAVKGIRVHSSPNQFRFPRLHRHQKFTQTRHVPQQPKFRLMLGQRGFRFKHPIAQRFDLRRGPLDVSRDQGVPAIRLKRSVSFDRIGQCKTTRKQNIQQKMFV